MSETNSIRSTACEKCGSPISYAPTVRRDGTEVENSIPRTCQQCKRRPPVVQICAKCGESFFGRRRKFCSPNCRSSARTPAERMCEECGHAYCGTRIHCGQTCRNRAAKRAVIEKAEARNRAGITIADVGALGASGQLGAIGELVFDLWCVNNGIQCARPIRENNPVWDRVILYEGQWQTVQIKASKKSNSIQGAIRRTRYAVDLVASVNTSTQTVAIVRVNGTPKLETPRMPDTPLTLW